MSISITTDQLNIDIAYTDDEYYNLIIQSLLIGTISGLCSYLIHISNILCLIISLLTTFYGWRWLEYRLVYPRLIRLVESHNHSSQNSIKVESVISYTISGPTNNDTNELNLRLDGRLYMSNKFPVYVFIQVLCSPSPIQTLPPSQFKRSGSRSNLNLRRKSIPKNIRHLVWKQYIGVCQGETKCPMCQKIILEQGACNGWDCGHVIPSCYGGSDRVENLRVICKGCNASMSDKFMSEYCQRHHPESFRRLRL